MRPPHEVLDLWKSQGLKVGDDARTFQRDLVLYCGGGWRSSLAFFYAWLLGIENVRHYPDGWAGWSTRYVQDPSAGGATPGWRQERTANPVDNRPEPEVLRNLVR